MVIVSKGERTRADIVACAKQLFYERGYGGTSFADIVSASGLSRGNIYHYFKTKDEILDAVIAQHIADFSGLLSEWEDTCAGAKPRLRAFVGMLTGRRTELAAFGCPIGSLNTELGKDQLGLQHTARGLFELFRHWLAERFRELGRDDEADTLALHLLGRAQGIAVITHVYRDPKLLRRETDALAAWIDSL